MHEQFSYEKRHRYPHMKPQDVLIWERFIEKYPDAYDHVFYDFEVGNGPAFDTIVNPETGGDDIKLYQYKIDVVGVKGGKTDLIEIKPRAGLSCCGQICGYRCLWDPEMTHGLKAQAVIITDELRPDIERVCKEMDIKIIVV